MKNLMDLDFEAYMLQSEDSSNSNAKHEDSMAYQEAMMTHGLINPFASGMTTCMFSSMTDNKVEGVSIDRIKLDYMKKSNLPGFKIVFETEHSTLYEMDRLETLNESEQEELDMKLDEFFFSLNDSILTFKSDSSEYLKIKELFGSGLANGLQFVYNKYGYKKIYLDLHIDQFLKDSNGNFVCVDSVMDINIYNDIQETH